MSTRVVRREVLLPDERGVGGGQESHSEFTREDALTLVLKTADHYLTQDIVAALERPEFKKRLSDEFEVMFARIQLLAER